MPIRKKYHPEEPYLKDNVKHANDARSFIKGIKQIENDRLRAFDLQTNLSSKGGIRLDSYVYTIEAFRERKIF